MNSILESNLEQNLFSNYQLPIQESNIENNENINSETHNKELINFHIEKIKMNSNEFGNKKKLKIKVKRNSCIKKYKKPKAKLNKSVLKAKKLERNRISAKECRMRKKNYIKNLENQLLNKEIEFDQLLKKYNKVVESLLNRELNSKNIENNYNSFYMQALSKLEEAVKENNINAIDSIIHSFSVIIKR